MNQRSLVGVSVWAGLVFGGLVLGVLVLGTLGIAPPPTTGRQAAAPAKYSGGYRIVSWDSLEAKGFFHFFYLHPDGGFLLGAEWPERETSRAVGRWEVTGEHLTLTGQVEVDSNQGRWRVPFARTYRITVNHLGIGLHPLPQKNRYGLLGWPDSYIFHRSRPTPNLPSGEIPATPRNIAVMIEALRDAWR